MHIWLVIAERRCRCLSNDLTCWPNNHVWQSFNQSIDGCLILPLPSAAMCHSSVINNNACIIATTEWTNSFWRSDQIGTMQNHNWVKSSCSVRIKNSTCNQSSIPILAVNATLPEHVQATIRFVSKYNLRLVITKIDHDYLGQSIAAGSFLLWLHHMKNITLIDQLSSCGTSILNIIRLSAGF